MRRFIIILVIICLLFIVYFSYHYFIELEKIDKLPFYEIPNFEIPEYNSDTIFLSSHNNVKKTVVLFFSPDCGFCEEEINGIIKSGYSSDKVRWIFITNPMCKDDIQFFLDRVPIYNIRGSIILVDSSLRYHSLFCVSAPPATFIYNERGKLEYYTGQSVSPQVLIKQLNK